MVYRPSQLQLLRNEWQMTDRQRKVCRGRTIEDGWQIDSDWTMVLYLYEQANLYFVLTICIKDKANLYFVLTIYLINLNFKNHIYKYRYIILLLSSDRQWKYIHIPAAEPSFLYRQKISRPKRLRPAGGIDFQSPLFGFMLNSTKLHSLIRGARPDGQDKCLWCTRLPKPQLIPVQLVLVKFFVYVG